MPISPAATIDDDWDAQRTVVGPERRGREAGFTLLELSLVLLIIVAVVGLVAPRLRDPGRAQLESAAHRLQLVFRLLRSEAALSGCAYRLTYDLDQQRYAVSLDESSCMDLEDFASDMGALARGTQLDEAVSFVDVTLPTLAGKVAQGQISTVFYPDGSIDPTVIHLATSKEAYTLWLGSMNNLKSQPGYSDVQYGS